jgi:hypothetical protein
MIWHLLWRAQEGWRWFLKEHSGHKCNLRLRGGRQGRALIFLRDSQNKVNKISSSVSLGYALVANLLKKSKNWLFLAGLAEVPLS